MSLGIAGEADMPSLGPLGQEMSKRLKRAVRDAAVAAHEEELRRALIPVDAAFQQWRAGQVSSGELAELIHRFHEGPARDLFKKYNYGQLELAVAHGRSRSLALAGRSCRSPRADDRVLRG